MSYDPYAALPGGYSPNDGTIEFYGRINSLIAPSMVVLDMGAGRAAWYEDDPSEYRKAVRLLKGKAAKVIAVDVDTAVLDNRSSDEQLLMVDGKIPLPDQSVDMIVSDYVLEHIVDVGLFCAEVDRVLKPGGWLCARTPHKYHFVSLMARIIKNSNHSRVLQFAQPGRKDLDVFPTAYKLNTLGDLKKNFPNYNDKSHIFRSDPSYYFGSKLFFKFLDATNRLVPSVLCGNIFVYLQKPG
ncbi:MAG: class I SAM-dependent methyltransferase [Blastomonas sp.]|jgi:ubiquinone/menaquinone biosynthesis C-methylase UbiE